MRGCGNKLAAMTGIKWAVSGMIGVGCAWVLIARPEWGVLWPSLLALLLVFTFRRVELALLAGALMGTLLLAGDGYWRVPIDLVEQHLLPHFASPWKSGAVAFTLILGGFVHLLERSGVLQTLLLRLLRGGSRRQVEAGAAGFGLVCFFDGLANSLMVGRIFQPLADRAGVSRLRLAYIVDTTSAAVACLAFVSTWIAFQLSMIREGFTLAGREAEADPIRWFLLSWPHNYYAIFSLVLMLVVIWRQWHIGPMRAAAAAAQPTADTSENFSGATSAQAWRAGLPVATLIALIFIGIYLDGSHRLGNSPLDFSIQQLALAFAEANVPVILILASGVASLLAAGCFPTGATPEVSTGAVFLEGVVSLLRPVLILIFAWALSSTLNDLGTADYIGSLLGGRVDVRWLPAMVFIASASVAFSTGTSWGTMGLMMPLAIPLCFALGAAAGSSQAVLPMVIAAVFSGAVFGDHCSPISDTTIVSSIASGVQPVDHVLTQLPYAFIAGLAALCLGFMPVPWLPWQGSAAVLAHAFFLACILLASSSPINPATRRVFS